MPLSRLSPALPQTVSSKLRQVHRTLLVYLLPQEILMEQGVNRRDVFVSSYCGCVSVYDSVVFSVAYLEESSWQLSST